MTPEALFEPDNTSLGKPSEMDDLQIHHDTESEHEDDQGPGFAEESSDNRTIPAPSVVPESASRASSGGGAELEPRGLASLNPACWAERLRNLPFWELEPQPTARSGSSMPMPTPADFAQHHLSLQCKCPYAKITA
ncbi:hypothetical protein FRC04_003842 [Tulasnella sp. 424]|nr:hypothetical protein FRC04_003842 [Tulasnella sp. 424]